jgi:hypothetical protein
MKWFTIVFGYVFIVWKLRYLIAMALILGLFIIGIAYANLTALSDNEGCCFPAHVKER